MCNVMKFPMNLVGLLKNYASQFYQSMIILARNRINFLKNVQVNRLNSSLINMRKLWMNNRGYIDLKKIELQLYIQKMKNAIKMLKISNFFQPMQKLPQPKLELMLTKQYSRYNFQDKDNIQKKIIEKFYREITLKSIRL